MACPCCINKTKEFGYEESSLTFNAIHGNLKEVERLISNGVAVNDLEGDLDITALMWSSAKGHLSIVKALLAAGADHTYVDKRACSALYLASFAGHQSVVSVLIEAGADKEIQCGSLHGDDDASWWTPLTISCAENHVGVVRVLLRNGADVERCESDRNSPLYFAAQNGNVEIVEELLEFGASIDRHTGDQGHTALTIACANKELAVVQRLTEAGASLIETEHSNGDSPLIQAAFVGADDVVAYLLSAGAKVDSPVSRAGATALMIAAQENHVSTARRLLMAGANINQMAGGGYSALYYAAETSSAEMCELLLSAGATVDARSNKLRTSLMFAIIHDNLEVAKVLISAGADVNARAAAGLCALFMVESSRAVDLLIKAGASPGMRDHKNNTALHHAALNKRNVSVLRSLLRCGCDPYAVNEKGNSPVELAKIHGHESVVENLEKLIAILKAGGPSALAACDNCQEYPAKPCGACKQVYYCGVKCQKECWSSHKIECKPPTGRQRLSSNASDYRERGVVNER